MTHAQRMLTVHKNSVEDHCRLHLVVLWVGPTRTEVNIKCKTRQYEFFTTDYITFVCERSQLTRITCLLKMSVQSIYTGHVRLA